MLQKKNASIKIESNINLSPSRDSYKFFTKSFEANKGHSINNSNENFVIKRSENSRGRDRNNSTGMKNTTHQQQQRQLHGTFNASKINFKSNQQLKITNNNGKNQGYDIHLFSGVQKMKSDKMKIPSYKDKVIHSIDFNKSNNPQIHSAKDPELKKKEIEFKAPFFNKFVKKGSKNISEDNGISSDKKEISKVDTKFGNTNIKMEKNDRLSPTIHVDKKNFRSSRQHNHMKNTNPATEIYKPFISKPILSAGLDINVGSNHRNK